MEISDQIKSLSLPAFREYWFKLHGRKPTAIEEHNFKASKRKYHSEAEKKAGQRAGHNRIERRVCADTSRREMLEANPEDWLKYYMAQAFKLSWADSHKAMIRNAIASAETGSGMVVAAPRGDGKSAILRGVALFLLLTGRISFPLVAPWTNRNATAHFRAWIKFISEKGSRLSEDYPEYLQPFEISTNTAKLKNLRWADNGELIGAEVCAADKQIVLPDSLGVIMTASVNGDIKGAQVTLKSGEIIRPDLLMLDDSQDAKRADNPEAVQDTIDTIESEWFCLSGPDTSLTVFNACTVKHEGDVSEYFLSHPDFKAVRISRVIAWPEGWEDDKSESWQHWQQWNEIRQQGRTERNEYYLKHKEIMTKGMAVSWVDRFDAKKKEIDAFQSAAIAYFRFGKKAFYSEYQNAPLKEGVDECKITPEMVLRRVTSRNAFELPEWSDSVFTATDINPSKALTTVIYAYGSDFSSACLWYGQYTGAPLPTNNDMSDSQKDKIIFGALWKQGEQLLTFPVRGKQWGVDGAGTQSNVCTRFAYEWNRAHPEMPCVVTYGRDSQRALGSPNNKLVRRRGPDNSWLLKRDRDPSFGWIDWILWNADYWRDFMIRTWTCETNAPGGSTLPKGNHRTFANHICSKTLAWKGDQNGVTGYRWKISSPEDHYADASNMCHVLADMNGIGNGNTKKQKSEFVAPIFRPSIRR